MHGFKLRIKKAVALAKEIDNLNKRKSVANDIRASVDSFKKLYDNDCFSVQEIFDFARCITDGVDSSVTVARYGYGSPEMEKLIERLSEEQERQLESRLWEEQMEERMRQERSSKPRSRL